MVELLTEWAFRAPLIQAALLRYQVGKGSLSKLCCKAKFESYPYLYSDLYNEHSASGPKDDAQKLKHQRCPIAKV